VKPVGDFISANAPFKQSLAKLDGMKSELLYKR